MALHVKESTYLNADFSGSAAGGYHYPAFLLHVQARSKHARSRHLTNIA
jgi:hypothetical protein